MSTLRKTLIACSDLHSYYSNATGKAHRLKTLYEASKNDNSDICFVGDMHVTTGGLFRGDYWQAFYEVFFDELSSLCTIMVAGNHDSGSNFGNGTVAYNGVDYSSVDYWKLRTGANDNLIIQKTINDGRDILLSISENGGTASSFSDETIAEAKEIITNNAERRIFVFIHYPTWYQVDSEDGVYTKTEGETTTEYTLKKNAFATRYGTGQTGAWSTVSAYPQPTNFLLWLSQQPNVIIFSGHTHNDWRLQEEELEYTVGSAIYKGGKFPNLKYYHVPNGAYMINLPSMRYRTEDALVEIYNDKVVVKARQGVYTTDGTPVSGAIDAMADNSTWELQELGSAYTYTIPLAESGVAAAVEYSITTSLSNCTSASSNPSIIAESGTATLQFTANTGYTLPQSVSVSGASYTWSSSTGTLTLSNPTGNVTISITATKISYSISVSLTGCSAASFNPTSIEYGATTELTFVADTGYALPDTFTVSGATSSWNQSTGKLTISNPTGAVSITIAAVEESTSTGSNIPIYTVDGAQILGLYELWTHGGIHPTHIYNKGGVEIIFGEFEGASSLDSTTLENFILA